TGEGRGGGKLRCHWGRRDFKKKNSVSFSPTSQAVNWSRPLAPKTVRAGHYRCLRCAVLFFFKAEDGIRDSSVTGVQTCALPISSLAVDTARGSPKSGHGGSSG